MKTETSDITIERSGDFKETYFKADLESAHIFKILRSSIYTDPILAVIREAYFKENFFFNGMFLNSSVYSLLAPVK